MVEVVDTHFEVKNGCQFNAHDIWVRIPVIAQGLGDVYKRQWCNMV